MNLYGIAAASRETGIDESSLRRWEEVGLISPGRIDLGKTNVRVYSEEEIETREEGFRKPLRRWEEEGRVGQAQKVQAQRAAI